MAAVGRIARAHGRRGEVILDPETDFPDERFRPGEVLFVERGGGVDALRIAGVRFQRERPVVAFAGVDSIDAAEALAGLELRVPREQLVALPRGTFYRHDLVGCAVETRDHRPVGVVTTVEGAVGGSRLVVAAPAGEVLIPLVADICVEIDTAARRIIVELPEGLVELNSGSG